MCSNFSKIVCVSKKCSCISKNLHVFFRFSKNIQSFRKITISKKNQNFIICSRFKNFRVPNLLVFSKIIWNLKFCSHFSKIIQIFQMCSNFSRIVSVFYKMFSFFKKKSQIIRCSHIQKMFAIYKNVHEFQSMFLFSIFVQNLKVFSIVKNCLRFQNLFKF